MCSHINQWLLISHFIMFSLPCRVEHKSLSKKSHCNSMGCHQPGTTQTDTTSGFPLLLHEVCFKDFTTKTCVSVHSCICNWSCYICMLGCKWGKPTPPPPPPESPSSKSKEQVNPALALNGSRTHTQHPAQINFTFFLSNFCKINFHCLAVI